jgi:NAD(P)H-dependent FMN reductase
VLGTSRGAGDWTAAGCGSARLHQAGHATQGFGDPDTVRDLPRRTKAWAAKVAEFDAFVFVTPEYNHGIPAALKNAIDFLFREWHHKAAGFVSYGGHANGSRAVEQLRLVLAEVHVAGVRAQVLLSLFSDFENFSVFKPAASREAAVTTMLDEVLAWGGALQTVRMNRASALQLQD